MKTWSWWLSGENSFLCLHWISALVPARYTRIHFLPEPLGHTGKCEATGIHPRKVHCIFSLSDTACWVCRALCECSCSGITGSAGCFKEQKMESSVGTSHQTDTSCSPWGFAAFHWVKFPFISFCQAKLLEEFCHTWPGEIPSDIMVGSSASQCQPSWPGALQRVCWGPTSYEVVSQIPTPAILQKLMGLEQSTWTWVFRLAFQRKKNNPTTKQIVLSAIKQRGEIFWF